MTPDERRSEWAGLRDGLRRVVAFRGARVVAPEIPAHPATVYRLLRADKPPALAIQRGVERVVERGTNPRPERKPTP